MYRLAFFGGYAPLNSSDSAYVPPRSIRPCQLWVPGPEQLSQTQTSSCRRRLGPCASHANLNASDVSPRCRSVLRTRPLGKFSCPYMCSGGLEQPNIVIRAVNFDVHGCSKNRPLHLLHGKSSFRTSSGGEIEPVGEVPVSCFLAFFDVHSFESREKRSEHER